MNKPRLCYPSYFTIIEGQGGVHLHGSVVTHADPRAAINCRWIADFNPVDVIDPLKLQGFYINKELEGGSPVRAKSVYPMLT